MPNEVPLLFPAGPLGENTSMSYRWRTVPCATWYQLWVNQNGDGWLLEWLEGARDQEIFSVELDGHGYGAYSWWVRPWSPDGFGPWSAKKNFDLGKLTPIEPSGTYRFTPTVIWNHVHATDASWFQIRINSDRETPFLKWIRREDAEVQTRGLAYDPEVYLPTGKYSFSVRPWSEDKGFGPWSDALDFWVFDTPV